MAEQRAVQQPVGEAGGEYSRADERKDGVRLLLDANHIKAMDFGQGSS